jgi:hypothetical protein
VNVLRKLHQALVPGGLLIDTQPVSRHPAVRTARDELGTLDMTAWGRTIEQIDRRTRRVVREGLFDVVHQLRFPVIDRFDHGAELATEARGWAGTSVDPALAKQIAAEDGPVYARQHVRLRVLQARR